MFISLPLVARIVPDHTAALAGNSGLDVAVPLGLAEKE